MTEIFEKSATAIAEKTEMTSLNAAKLEYPKNYAYERISAVEAAREMKNLLDFEITNEESYRPIDDGIYEVSISHAELKTSKKGNPYIDIVLVIRNDVEQAFKNARIYHKIFSVGDTKKFNQKILLNYAQALKFDKAVHSIEEYVAELAGRNFIVQTKQKQREYQGEKKTEILVTNVGVSTLERYVDPVQSELSENRGMKMNVSNALSAIDDVL